MFTEVRNQKLAVFGNSDKAGKVHSLVKRVHLCSIKRRQLKYAFIRFTYDQIIKPVNVMSIGMVQLSVTRFLPANLMLKLSSFVEHFHTVSRYIGHKELVLVINGV